MQSVGTRGRLLAGAALGLGFATLAPQQALAACVVTASSVTCAPTTTTNTTNAGATPASDRNYPADTTATDFIGTVTSGSLVDGYGLSFDNTAGGAFDLNVVNDGTIQVNAGNIPTAGGTSALDITAINGTDINYSGTGDILNLGTGDGLQIDTTGTGNLTATVGGSVTSTTGTAIDIINNGTAGNVLVYTAAGETLTAVDDGIEAEITGVTNTGTLTISSQANIVGGSSDGILASTQGLGAVTVVNQGQIGTAGVRFNNGVQAEIDNAASTANLDVSGVGLVYSVDDGVIATNLGTGATTVAYSGAIDTTAGDGINATSTTGALTITSGTVTAVGGNAIDAESTGGNITVTAGVLTATGDTAIVVDQSSVAGAGDISILANGPVSGTVGIDASNAGTGGVTITTTSGIVVGTAGSAIIAEDVNALSADPIAVNVGTGGASGTGADAVVATTLGTGTVTVSSAGPVTSDTGDGITTSATTGATAVNVTAGSVTGGVDGINATATTGPIAVTLSGGADVTGIDDAISVDSGGAMTVGIGAGSVVSGAFGVFGSGGGTLAVTNAGTLGTTGTVSVITDINTAANVTNQTGGVVNGRFDLSDLADSVSNAGTLNLDGAQNFLLGADAITNQSGGIVNVAAGTTFNGLEALTNNSGGTLNAASGLTFDGGDTTLTNAGLLTGQGTLDFGAGTDAFFNNAGGVFTLTGATTLSGLESLSNAGTINLDTFTLTGPAIAFVNNGTIDTNGSAGLAGFTSFDNAATLDLAAGTFTVPAAIFTNSGTILADEGAATITGQTSFANTGTVDLQDGAVGDVLTIDSDFAGSVDSTLLVDFSPTAADLLVIDGAASGTTTIDANYLGGGFNFDGVLVVDALTASVDAFVLGTVSGDSPLIDFSLVQDEGDFFLVAEPTAATFDPLVVPGFAMDLWYQSANEVFAETSKPATTAGISLWGEGYISRDKYGEDDDSVTIDGVAFDVDNEIKTKRHGVQLGVDYGMAGARIGLTGGYGWAKANGNNDADLKAKGWNLGLYGQVGGVTGFHAEFLAKHDRYDAEFDDGAFDNVDFDIRSTGFDGSLGYRFGIGGDGNMDILAGLSHVRTKVDDIEAFGFVYDSDKLTSTRGRAGVRGVFGGALAPYVAATVYHEFKGDGDVELFDGVAAFDLDTKGKGTWARLEAGISGNDGPGPILAAWGDLGDRKGLGLRAGWRIGGGIDAAPPPPPPPAPPPPPEAPATQTCADGSVILATDSCPLPPPPPPPPAPEPERG